VGKAVKGKFAIRMDRFQGQTFLTTFVTCLFSGRLAPRFFWPVFRAGSRRWEDHGSRGRLRTPVEISGKQWICY